MRSSLVVAFTACAVTVLAQTPGQIAAQFPSCVTPCNDAAIENVDCSSSDFGCYCTHVTQIVDYVLPCVKENSTCTTTDIENFSALVPQVCDAQNGTTISTTTSPATTSTSISSSSTSSPLTTGSSATGPSSSGATPSSTTAPNSGVVAAGWSGGVGGLVGLTLLGWLL